MMKNRLDKLNGKQEHNEKVVKTHEEINAGHKISIYLCVCEFICTYNLTHRKIYR